MAKHELEEEDYQRPLDLGIWRRLLRHARPYRGPIAGLAASGLVLAVADALLPLVTGRVIDAATGQADRTGLTMWCLAYLGLALTFPVLVVYFIVMAGRLSTGVGHDLRRDSFARLQDLSFSYYDKHAVGWLMARLTSDCGRLAQILPWTVLDTVWGTLFLLGMATVMLWLNWQIALLVMTTMPVLVVISLFFQRRLLRSQRAVRKSNSEMTASFNESIMGIRTTRSLVREEENLKEFQVQSTTMYRESVRNALQAAVYLPLVITLGSVGVGLALWRSGVQMGNEMSLGTLVAFIQYAALFYMPIQEMAERFTQLQAAQASAERIQGLLDTEPEIQDSPEVLAAMQQRRARAASRAIRAEGAFCDPREIAADGYAARIRRVEFKNVSFAYKEGEAVLHDFNLRVRAGQTIALVGATGSGKTTIVNLLARFYEPTSGSIEIDGVDYRKRSLHWLQSNLGIILQTPHLFSGTIRENIRYGRLTATDAEVEEAARLVNADAFIRTFDDGYDTDVGERGDRLSMGQRQLVALARAVLARPQIFIMDEATSSVDTETEQLIQSAIEKVLAGRISFIIAHRLSTIRNANRILVIDSGRVVEQGTHRDLLLREGRYHDLYTKQFTRERQERILEGAELE